MLWIIKFKDEYFIVRMVTSYIDDTSASKPIPTYIQRVGGARHWLFFKINRVYTYSPDIHYRHFTPLYVPYIAEC